MGRRELYSCELSARFSPLRLTALVQIFAGQDLDGQPVRFLAILPAHATRDLDAAQDFRVRLPGDFLRHGEDYFQRRSRGHGARRGEVHTRLAYVAHGTFHPRLGRTRAVKDRHFHVQTARARLPSGSAIHRAARADRGRTLLTHALCPPHGVPVVPILGPATQTNLVVVTRRHLARPRELVRASKQR